MKKEYVLACKYNHQKKSNIDWAEREETLKRLLSKFKKNNGYDVVVPGSGGKDSAYLSFTSSSINTE